MRRLRNTAFTLIELLVVIAIVAILVAMLMPALKKARTQAGLTQCLSGARQAHLSIMMYGNDYDQYYPYGSNNESWVPTNAQEPLWHQKLVNLGYMKKDVQTRRGGCPWGPTEFLGRYPGGDYYTHPNIEWPAAFPYSDYAAAVSYGLNGYLQSGMHFEADNVTMTLFQRWAGPYKQTSSVVRKHSSKIGEIFCVPVAWHMGTQDIWPVIHFSVGQDPAPYFPTLPPAGRHHRAGIPVVYCDGHGEIVPRSGVQSPVTPNGPLLWWSHQYLVYYKVNPSYFQ